MSNPSQLLLLLDHIKLSLLERQRAQSLKIDLPPSTDTNISRSLASFSDQLESLAQRTSDHETISNLRSQYNDLYKQFYGDNSPAAQETLTSPNNADMTPDFDQAQSRSTRTSRQRDKTTSNTPFKDNPSQIDLDDEDDDDDANRAALFPNRYRDEETPTPDPTAEMDNQQIHVYHQQVIDEQDEQLDRLGESIGRQRYLGMQISDELEGQVALLDEVDRGVGRQQNRLDGAKRRLNVVSRKARENWGLTTIIVLIVILVLLIVVLK